MGSQENQIKELLTTAENTNKIESISKPNNKTDIYFAARIFPRLIGRMRRSLIVPQLNSLATILAAMIMVNNPAKSIIWEVSFTKPQIEYSSFGEI